MPPAHSQPDAATRAIAGQALKFIGLMTTLGGALAGLRTLGLPEHHWFYALFIPAGLVIWLVGFFLCGTAARERSHG